MNKFMQISFFFLWFAADTFGTSFTFDQLLAIPAFKTLSPTLFPKQNFRVDNDVIMIRNKLSHGHGMYVLEMLTERTHAQRLEILAKYYEKYNENLVTQMLEAGFREEQKDFIAALLIPREYVAYMLHHYLSNPETMGYAVLEILGTMPNSEKKEVISTFNMQYNISLQTMIDEAVTDEEHKALLHKLVETDRSESESRDVEQAVVDAATLFRIGVDVGFKKYDMSIINEILCSRSVAQLKLSTAIFKHDGIGSSPHDALFSAVIDIPTYFADVVRHASYNLDYYAVNWVLALRCEIDLGLIITVYDKKYGGKGGHDFFSAVNLDDFYLNTVVNLYLEYKGPEPYDYDY